MLVLRQPGFTRRCFMLPPPARVNGVSSPKSINFHPSAMRPNSRAAVVMPVGATHARVAARLPPFSLPSEVEAADLQRCARSGH